MRRSATVTSSVPRRLDRRGQRSSERKPPVPSSSRERSVVAGDGQTIVGSSVTAIGQPPWIARRISTRAPSCNCVRRPTAPRGTTSRVDGDRDAAARGRQVERVERGLRRSRRRPARSRSPLSTTFMRDSFAKRRGSASGGPVRQRLAGERARDEVGGDRREQDAVAVVPGRPDAARRARPGRSRAGCRASPGRRPGEQLLDLELEHAGHELGAVAQQLVDAAGGRRACRSRAPPSSRRARSGRRRAGRGSASLAADRALDEAGAAADRAAAGPGP